MMFKRRRRTEQELLLRAVDDVLKQLRALCGALLLGKRRGTHAAYERWLDDAETALARLEALRESIAQDQELRR
jgi:hypothetical protein